MTAFCMAALLSRNSVRAFQSVPTMPKFASPARSLVSVAPSIISSSRWQRTESWDSRSRLWMSTSVDLDELNSKIKAKGDEIRQLKEGGIDKTALAPHVEELLALKAQLPSDESAEPPKKEKSKPSKQRKPAVPAQKKVEEMSDSELRLNRISKVQAIRDANVEPFEYAFQTTRTSAQLAAEYEGRLDDGAEDEDSDVAVAGRIMTRRVFGKLAFFTMQDETGIIQLQFDKKRLGDTFKVRIVFCSSDDDESCYQNNLMQ